jgi:DNA-binding MarR family transcriptional regulator
LTKLTATHAIPANSLTELLERASRSMHSLGYAEGLYPAQWTALRYFSKAEEGRRTASELARFQGLATGPVSRTVRTLILKKLIIKSEVQPSGRAEHLELTRAGRDLLLRDPINGIVQAVDGLSGDEREALAAALEQVIRVASTIWPAQQRSD